MKIKHFEDTDTLYIELRASDIDESKDLDENTTLDVDTSGTACAMTLEHASKHTDIDPVQLEGIAA